MIRFAQSDLTVVDRTHAVTILPSVRGTDIRTIEKDHQQIVINNID